MLSKQFTSIIELLDTFPTEQSCIDYLVKMRWKDKVISPFSKHSKVYKCKNNRYKCVHTGKYFNVKTNTLFDNTKISLRKWFVAIWIVTSYKKGISSIQLSKELCINQRSAWYMLHRIRKCFKNKIEALNDNVEIDETYIGGKNKNRHFSKRIKNSQGRSYRDKVPVVGMVERNENQHERKGLQVP